MYIKVNGINIYYDKVGIGNPIILLHGNGENGEIFDKLVSKLKSNYTVYTIDNRCHGKSDKAKDISYNIMADDIIKIIKKLKIEKPILYGFSDGGIIGLLIALKNQELLSKLIISGANLTPDGIQKKTLNIMKLCNFFFRNKKTKMMLNEPNITTKQLNKIIIPVHILVGENDLIIPEHTKLIHNNIINSTLEVIKGENHSSYIIHNEKLHTIIKKYL